MALHYDFYLSPNSRGSNRKRFHARPVSNSIVRFEKLLAEASKKSVYTEEELKTALATLMEVVEKHLAEGDHIQIPGLGGFQVSLKCPETRTPEATRSGSVTIKSVSYTPERQLVKTLRTKAEIKKARHKKHSFRDGDMDSVMQHLQIYFQTNRYLTRKDMETHCFLTQATANRKIKELVEQGVLVNVCSDQRHPLYELAKPL